MNKLFSGLIIGLLLLSMAGFAEAKAAPDYTPTGTLKVTVTDYDGALLNSVKVVVLDVKNKSVGSGLTVEGVAEFKLVSGVYTVVAGAKKPVSGIAHVLKNYASGISLVVEQNNPAEGKTTCSFGCKT